MDVRGEGGFVVAPPSIHKTGVQYEWEISPDDAAFAQVPKNLLELLTVSPSRQLQTASRRAELMELIPHNRFRDILEERLNDALDELRAAGQGARNDTLNRVAFGLAQMVAPAGADWDLFAAELLQSAVATGLSESESRGTLKSAWEAGSAQPSAWVALARDWVYASNRDQFIHVESKRPLSQKAFNRTFNAQLPNLRGSIGSYLTDTSLMERVYDLRLDPSKPAVYEHDGFMWLNTYVPPEIEPVEGDATSFVDFLEHLIPNPSERSHLVRWLAHAVRCPGDKISHALMLRTARQGVGKTTLANIARALIGEENTRKANSDELRGQFQSFLGDKLLVIFEETNLGAGQGTYNRIKDMISDDTVVINEKYVPAREARNLANFIFLSNLDSPLLMEPDDRRIFYVDSPAAPREPEYYQQFQAWWPQSLGVVRHWLDQVDLSEFDPRARPPQTQSHALLGAKSRNLLEQELLVLFRYRVWPFARDLVTLDEVRRSLPPYVSVRSTSHLVDALKAIGARDVGQHRTNGAWHYYSGEPHWVGDKAERQSLWVIDNAAYWDLVGPAARAEEFARSEGLLYPAFPDNDLWKKPLGVLVQ
jgi:hypothetical protein